MHVCIHMLIVHLICMQSQHHSSPPPHRFLSFPHPAFHLSPPQLFIFPSTMQLSVTCKCTTKSWVETWKQVCQDSDIIICMSILRLCRFYSRSSQLYSCKNLNMYSRPFGIGIAGDPLSYPSTLPSDNTCTQTHAIRKVHVTTLTNFKNIIQSHVKLIAIKLNIRICTTQQSLVCVFK